ncbi:MAG: hypothetical protein KC910_02365 [Candidatus Eremiobacteraeota bacterium]|nr:hypothetical protein [Candidatus Eremiobacteraeota bacterium]
MEPVNPEVGGIELEPGEQVMVVNPEKMELLAQRASGAGWIRIVGILAVVNSILIVVGADLQFIFGLGITTIVTAVAQAAEAGVIGSAIALGFTLIGCAGALFFASFAERGYAWAFVVAMVLYALDGALWLVFSDWIEVIAHSYAIYRMYLGLAADKELKSRFA